MLTEKEEQKLNEEFTNVFTKLMSEIKDQKIYIVRMSDDINPLFCGFRIEEKYKNLHDFMTFENLDFVADNPTPMTIIGLVSSCDMEKEISIKLINANTNYFSAFKESNPLYLIQINAPYNKIFDCACRLRTKLDELCLQ